MPSPLARSRKALLAGLLICAVLLAPAHGHAATVTVFAAMSLTDSLREVATAYEKKTGDRIVFNFAASGPLARQIEAGAPADIFFSADETRADELEKKGLLVRETRQSRLSNSLVIVTATNETAIASAADLALPVARRIALGDVRTVPVGAYAKAYLEEQGLWAAVQPKVVPCENARAVLAVVESGNVEAGIVYRTDASVSRKVKVAFEVPRNQGPAIRYPMALVKDSPQADAATRFLRHLAGDEAGAVFVRHGFILETAAKRH